MDGLFLRGGCGYLRRAVLGEDGKIFLGHGYAAALG
jgi:hypothetical protein